MRYHRIPNETVHRLPIYLRGLLRLSEQGQQSVSSRSFADLVNVNPWQIRKDFSYFGDFGTRGVGYSIDKLEKHIRKILRLDVVNKTALMGVGNLGSAVLAYPGFKTYGFYITAAFDNDPEKIGNTIESIEIEDVSKICTLRERDVHLAIVAVPGSAAQQIADALVGAGVKGILNFSPVHVIVPKKVKVITIEIAMDLARLPYYMPAS